MQTRSRRDVRRLCLDFPPATSEANHDVGSAKCAAGIKESVVSMTFAAITVVTRIEAHVPIFGCKRAPTYKRMGV